MRLAGHGNAGLEKHVENGFSTWKTRIRCCHVEDHVVRLTRPVAQECRSSPPS